MAKYTTMYLLYNNIRMMNFQSPGMWKAWKAIIPLQWNREEPHKELLNR